MPAPDAPMIETNSIPGITELIKDLKLKKYSQYTHKDEKTEEETDSTEFPDEIVTDIQEESHVTELPDTTGSVPHLL